MTDPIADMLTRIRNAYLAQKETVDIPFSRLKHDLAKKLESLEYVDSVETIDDSKIIRATLKYISEQPAVTLVKRISKPGRRVYVRADKITPTLSGHGSKILTTSHGILTDKEAKQTGVGGEIICEIY